MSRLFDRLAGLDRGRARPAGMGNLSILAAVPGTQRVMASDRLFGYPTVHGRRPGCGVGSPSEPGGRYRPAPSPPPPSVPVSETESPVEPLRASVSPLLAQGLEAAQRGELADAEGYFRRAVAQDAGDAEAWNSLGVVLVRQGEQARGGGGAAGRPCGCEPSHIEAHRNLGVALDRQGRAGEAAEHYRFFLSLTTDAHPGRGDVRRRLLELGSVRTGV